MKNEVKGPFLRSKNSTPKIMKNLFIALLPIIIFSFYKNGIYPYIEGKATIYGMLFPLIFILTGVISSCVFESLFAFIFMKKRGKVLKEYLKHSYMVFPGLFLSLVLPINTPISILIFGCFVATIITKMLYGGFGHNIFNPALVGCLFIIFTYSAQISSLGGYLNVYEVDTISKATPLTNQAVVDGIGTYETLVKPYGSLFDFFTGMIPGAVGETSALLCIVAFIYLSIKRVIKFKIPLIYIGTVFVMTLIIGNINSLGIWYPLFQILSGGLMFGAVFMATDPVTSPVTNIGQIIYALFLGILTVTFRYLTPLPEGVLTSILTMNMLVVILDKIGSKQVDAIKKSIIPLLLAIFLIVAISIHIGNSYNVEVTSSDPNFNIIETTSSNNKTIYTVTQRGNGGLIKSELTIENGKVTQFIVKENKETEAYYAKVEAANYIETLINNQSKLEDLDTISGATISSTALKKTIINVLKDYEANYEK